LERLYGVAEASQLLGISHWTLRAYLKAGRLSPVRIGRRVLLDDAELREFVSKCKAASSVSVLAPN